MLDLIDKIVDFFEEHPQLIVIIVAVIMMAVICIKIGIDSSSNSKTTNNSSNYSEVNEKYYSDPFNTQYSEEIIEEIIEEPVKEDKRLTLSVDVSIGNPEEKETEAETPFRYHIISIMDGSGDIKLYCEKYHYEEDDIIIERIFKKDCCKETIERLITKRSLIRRIEDKKAKSEKDVYSDCFIGTMVD